MIGSSVMVVCNIVLYNNSVHVAEQQYAVKEDLFSYPVKSSVLGIYKVSRILENLELYPVSEVLCKYVVILEDLELYPVSQVLCKYVVILEDLELYPVSQVLCKYVVILEDLELYPVSQVLCKYVVISYRNIHVVVPLLHTYANQ